MCNKGNSRNKSHTICQFLGSSKLSAGVFLLLLLSDSDERLHNVNLCRVSAGLKYVGVILYRPDGLSTVKVDEKERFEDIKERLRVILENQIVNFRWLPTRQQHITTKVIKHYAYLYFITVITFSVYIFPFRYCFPFGRPEGALKATLSLLERVCKYIYFLKAFYTPWNSNCDVIKTGYIQ